MWGWKSSKNCQGSLRRSRQNSFNPDQSQASQPGVGQALARTKWADLSLGAWALIAVGLALGGCSRTLNMHLAARSSGSHADTSIVAVAGHPSGEMVLQLNGKTYSGRWVYMSGPGSVSIGAATVFSGLRTAAATGTAIGMPMQGGGSASLSAPDGSTLRCSYDYSAISKSGVGICQDSKGEFYDLQIY